MLYFLYLYADRIKSFEIWSERFQILTLSLTYYSNPYHPWNMIMPTEIFPSHLHSLCACIFHLNNRTNCLCVWKLFEPKLIWNNTMTFQRVPIPLYKEYVQHHHYMTHVQIYRCRYFIHVGLYIQVDVIHTLLFTVHTYTYTVHT